MRVLVIVFGTVAGLVAGLAAGSYLVASHTASTTAMSRAPDLGRVESNLGFHALGDSTAQPLSWEFSYGPSGEGPIMFQVYVGVTGHVLYTEPPPAGDRTPPPPQ